MNNMQTLRSLLHPWPKSGKPAPRRLAGWVVMVCLFCVLGPLAAGAAPFAEYKVKAAFLLKFADFIEWPTDSPVASGSEPLRLGVIGGDPFGELLPDEISPAPYSEGPSFQVARLSIRDEKVRACNLVFFTGENQDATAGILGKIAGTPILTVGEGENFLSQGGIIAFTMENNRVRFLVNLKAARKARLKISSKLLGLAQKVIQ